MGPPGHPSTGGWPRFHSPLGAKVFPSLIPCTSCRVPAWGSLVLLSCWGPAQGSFSLYSTFVGGELLPAAPLQPCAGAPSGRGHLFSGWVNLAPCNYSSNNVLLAVQAWGTPSAWRHVPRPPIRWVLSGRWVFIRALPVHSLPTIAHYMVSCLFCAP